MTFLRSLFFNALAVFIVDRMIPGVEIDTFENLPNIGADFLFALIVGFLNALIFPTLSVVNVQPTFSRIAVVAFFFSFGSFVMIYFLHLGVMATNFEGVFIGGSIVWAVSVLTNIWYQKSKLNL